MHYSDEQEPVSINFGYSSAQRAATDVANEAPTIKVIDILENIEV